MISATWQYDELISRLGTLYPEVIYVAFFKVYRPDGTLYRAGYTDDRSWPFLEAVNPELMFRCKKRALSRFAQTIREQVGRDPVEGEILLAFRPAQAFFHSVFVDDVTDKTKAHILIETSPGNWHAHFILDREVNIDIAAKIQRYMIQNCVGTSRPTADPAAASPKQARRFPERRFIHDAGLRPLNVDEILMGIKLDEEKKKQLIQQNRLVQLQCQRKSREENWDDEALEQVYARHSRRINDDKKAKDKSYSAVDLAFAMYMVGHCGLDVDFVSDALVKVSPNIECRHSRVEDYLRRTLEIAVKYSKDTY